MATDRDRDPEADPLVPSTQKATMEATMQPALGPLNNQLDSIDIRADPDAQATVTDFLDFTEYLPADMMRSLTLIGKLDQTYSDASAAVHDLTSTWGNLPTMGSDNRPAPVQLRAEISENLRRALSSRIYAHAEATRMADNVTRHYNRAKIILAKLQTMLDNYPTAEEQKSPVAASKSPQLVRAPKLTLRVGDGQKVRRQRLPRITVPGEVLAPYDLDYDAFTDESDESSDEDESDTPPRRTPGRITPGPTRIKLVHKNQKKDAQKTPKPSSRANRPIYIPAPSAGATSSVVLQPPPENAVLGSADAPWLQLTAYELAKLRKRMKKNATWNPSDTMIARELKSLGRGPEAFRQAKQKAEAEGQPFEAVIPTVVIDGDSGRQVLPEGAISAEGLGDDEMAVSDRGVRLNEAKKLKREAMAKLAAEEAEASARKMAEAARLFIGAPTSRAGSVDGSKDSNTKSGTKPKAKPRAGIKRKRDSVGPEPEKTDGQDTTPARPQVKRTRTETPVLPPQVTSNAGSLQSHTATPIHPPMQHSTTPVPIPIPLPGQEAPLFKASTSPPASTTAAAVTVTTTVPTKPPAQTPIHPPTIETRKSTTPILPPVRDHPRRETRQDTAKKMQQLSPPLPQLPAASVKQSLSQAGTPRTTPGPEASSIRRPGSRGKAMSQEPLPSLASDRPRRASTARNTPAPEPRQQGKRAKRPAPGIVSTTSSGGNSAVGKRMAAPRRKARASKKEKDRGQAAEPEMEEVDDEGNPIDPEEPRYCLCNRVSFGTMIQCDNVDNCKGEWYHLECVGLTDIPARTTKWYCPDCRVLLNIGERGEVSARGVRM